MTDKGTIGAALLTAREMGRADELANAEGIPGIDLMEAAGRAVAHEICQRFSLCPTVVLAGPGNNGGDGFVVARLLAADGWPVRVALLGSKDNLKGDAAVNRDRWTGDIEPLNESVLDACGLVVDALFGAGLTRPLDGIPLAVVQAIMQRGLDCVAIDIPSGVDGDTGVILGTIRDGAPKCVSTVTFFRAKPGHYLLPGRDLIGELVVAPIGIPDSVLGSIDPHAFLNGPGLWGERFPWPEAAGNKYSRGHAVVVGGPEMTGAARLAAVAARRVGAGLLTIAAPPEAVSIYAVEEPGNIIAAIDGDAAFEDLLSDARRNAVLIGPGSGLTDITRRRALAALKAGKGCVLDADALSVFKDDPDNLFGHIAGPCVLTPHEGEFHRLFGPLFEEGDGGTDKLSRARAAAEQSAAVVLLKGADTVIADPDGRVAINTNAPPDLASAGTGDVLAGLVVGLLAQGMVPWDAACAAVWLHGAAATHMGPGLIAEDLVGALPGVLTNLKREG